MAARPAAAFGLRCQAAGQRPGMGEDSARRFYELRSLETDAISLRIDRRRRGCFFYHAPLNVGFAPNQRGELGTRLVFVGVSRLARLFALSQLLSTISRTSSSFRAPSRRRHPASGIASSNRGYEATRPEITDADVSLRHSDDRLAATLIVDITTRQGLSALCFDTSDRDVCVCCPGRTVLTSGRKAIIPMRRLSPSR